MRATVTMVKLPKQDTNFFGFCHLAVMAEGLSMVDDLRGQIRVSTRNESGYYADFRNRSTYKDSRGNDAESIAVEVGKEIQGVVNKVLNSCYETDVTEIDLEWNGEAKKWKVLEKRSTTGGEVEGLEPTSNAKAVQAAKHLSEIAATKNGQAATTTQAKEDGLEN